MPHDRIASIVAQARLIRDGLDPACLETPVRTATLAMLLDTLIELGVQPATALAYPKKQALTVRDEMRARATEARQ